jgi:PhoH-like ATPase
MLSARPGRLFVLDTNVLLHDPEAVFAFHEHDLVLPMQVLEEVDRFKREQDEVGRNARRVARLLDELRANGSLRDGVPLHTGGRLRVASGLQGAVRWEGWTETADNRILSTALGLHQTSQLEVTLVTRDVNMRLKADALGVRAEDYENAQLTIDEPYGGLREAEVEEGLLHRLKEGQLSVAALGPGPWYPHQFMYLQSPSGGRAIGRVDSKQQHVRLIQRGREPVWGIQPRNKEQVFALELLMDASVHLVTLCGTAGTGKTLLALAAALAQVTDQPRFRRVLVSRPIFPLGRDLGHLPGDVDAKLDPWMKPIYDNLDFLLAGRGELSRERSWAYLMDQGLLQIEPLTYIRGRSLPRQLLLVDEAQNLTPHEVKTVLTRAGEGTKVVLVGDPQQVDLPYVDALSNGLTYAVERFKTSALAGHVTLRKGERSPLADLAARLL